MDVACTSMDLNLSRGRGPGSRLAIAQNALPEGWKCEHKSPKYLVWTDDQGKRYRSSMAVKLALKDRGFLTASESESDLDTASEYNPSPLKKARCTSR